MLKELNPYQAKKYVAFFKFTQSFINQLNFFWRYTQEMIKLNESLNMNARNMF